jgi:hypothetical protein
VPGGDVADLVSDDEVECRRIFRTRPEVERADLEDGGVDANEIRPVVFGGERVECPPFLNDVRPRRGLESEDRRVVLDPVVDLRELVRRDLDRGNTFPLVDETPADVDAYNDEDDGCVEPHTDVVQEVDGEERQHSDGENGAEDREPDLPRMAGGQVLRFGCSIAHDMSLTEKE